MDKRSYRRKSSGRKYQRKSSNKSRPRKSRKKSSPRRRKKSSPRRRRKSSPQIKTITIRRHKTNETNETNEPVQTVKSNKKNSKYIRLGGDHDVNRKKYYGGSKGGETKQDKISKDPKLMKSKFNGFTLIPKDQYKYINEGTFIRYLKDGKDFRFGGYLKANKYPEYWVLQNKTRGDQIASWCVPLKSKNIYASRDNDRRQDDAETKAMREAFSKLKSGEYKLVPKSKQTKQQKNDEPTRSKPVKILFVGETD